jgi:hypothetical protein
VGIHRPTHLLKALLFAGIAVASLAGTSVVAHAGYPPPKETHSIQCSHESVSSNDGTCTVTFTDKAKGEGAGQRVCFTVKGPGTVNPSCSFTNSNGQAFTTFTANSKGCGHEESSKEESGTKATITGTEGRGREDTSVDNTRDEAGTAQTTVKIKCPNSEGDTPGGTAQQTDSGSTNAADTSARNTGASVAPLSAAQVVPVAAILAVILLLSVAITGRLSLRRLRR